MLSLRRGTALAVALAITAALALAGCTDDNSTPAASTPVPTSSAGAALNALLPVVPAKLTEASTKKETERLADEIEALIASTEIVHVADTSKLFAKTADTGAYYGVLRVVNVSKGLDPVQQSTAMVTLLESAGWIQRQVSDTKTKYVATLSSDNNGARAWLALVGGDATVKKSGVVTIQLISPDLP